MASFDAAIFDLDGTIADSRPGIIDSYRAALSSLGHRLDETMDLTPFIGPPMEDAMPVVLRRFGDDRVDLAIARFREHYAGIGIKNSRPYDGIPPVLERLHRSGVALYVATSKRDAFAQDMISQFGLGGLLAGIYGSGPEPDRRTKSGIIRLVLSSHIIHPERAVMVGDRAVDIAGARDNGIAGIGVLWGYGTCDELKLAQPAYVISDPEELSAIIGR